MWILSIFVKNVVEIGPYYGENGSSRLQKRLNYGGNTKKSLFLTFFNTIKIKNLHFRPLNLYANSWDTPYMIFSKWPLVDIDEMFF